MASKLRTDVDFGILFKKLGHHLEEIRIRALENILSKLEHKLICDSDLVQERHLFIRLLEWFNFPKSPRHADVLNLLLRLTKHTSAAEVLQDIGGIDFLTHLRKDVSPALQPLVDQILENAMRLPDVQPELDHAPECIYQKHNHTSMLTGMEMTMESAVSRPSHDHAAMITSNSNTSRPVSRPPLEPGHLPDYREPPLGFFEGDKGTGLGHYGDPGGSVLPVSLAEPSSCFRITIFPWLALTPTDRHVIVSTNTSLQSRDAALLVNTCEFLSDVVFQDFPAEIFLQRPNIIKNLLSLLSGPMQDAGRPRLHAIRTLADFAGCLKSKIHCHQDPNLYTAKQDFSTTPSPFSTPSSSTSVNNNNNHHDGRPSVIGWTDTRHRGDGRDGDTTSSSGSSHVSSEGYGPGPEVEQMDFEDMPSLQYIQMTIPQFCAAILEKALPLLKTNDEVMVNETFYLLNKTFDIIVAIVTHTLWEDNSMAARECSDKFLESLDVLADLMKFHHHGNAPNDLEESDIEGPADLVQHRLAFIGLSVFLGNFLRALVPREKSRGVISENLLPAINLLVYDECLSHAHPTLQLELLGYLQHLDDGRHSVYVSTATICQAMQKTCKFLVSAQEETSRLTKETLSLCEGAFPSLPYHRHLAYVTETVNLCADVCTKSQHYEHLQAQYRKLVIKCLSHPLPRIRHHIYTTILKTVQTHLSVAKASDPGSTAYERVKFIINADMLYEIIVFGLADKDTKVCQAATDLMSHLLKSQLLMSPDLWQTFLQCLLRGLPVLQSYACLNTVLGTTVLGMLETQKSTVGNDLPVLEKFRGTLRCLLSSDVKVRSDVLKRLSWYLTNEEDSGRKLPMFSELDVSNLSNILIVDTPRSVEDDLGRSVFQVDGLRKVYEIFTSLSVDPGVKKSAVDQLAIILQDQSLHSAFRKDGGLEKILEHLQLGIMKDGDSNTNAYLSYLPGCMTILRHLVHYDYSLRHKLAHDAQVYHTLLRVALLYSRDVRTCYEVSHTLTLLLFDEQARFFMGGSKNTAFSVPSVVKQRYRLPFRPTCHYETSPHQVAPPPDPDPLMTGLPLEMLRISWNVAWNSGMDNLVKNVSGTRTREEPTGEFSAKLKLSPTDRVILITSHYRQGLQAAVHDIANATSHYSVSRSLTRILSHLVARSDRQVINVFHSLDWSGAVARFVKVTPSSSADETLLFDILRFINLILKMTNQVPDNILQWIGEVLYHPKGPLISLLHRQSAREPVDESAEPISLKRSLDKSLLGFIASYNSSLPYLLTVRLKFHQLRGDLVHRLLQRLNVTDAPHFYNLASLEGTLNCLMHITARPGWSTECTEQESLPLCNQVLSSLLEVICAFHIGRGGTSMSYMGRGVTKAATLCLRHLVYEMATVSADQKWPRLWLYNRHGDQSTEDSGLDWMMTLWAYRDAEVRTAGLGLAVTLSTVAEGRMLLTSNCKHIPGGIWAAAFSILLDQSECSMVRQQAALLLVNLTSEALPSGTTEAEINPWQGPIVMDTECNVSLVGLPALLALLHHCQFYREMMLLLSCYYPQPNIQPAITSELYQLSASSSENNMSALADAGLIPKFGSHHNTMSLLQASAMSSVRTSERPGAIGGTWQSASQQTPSSSNRTTPTTREQAHEGEATTEEQARESIEYQYVTTPCLVSAVSQLVRNLLLQAPADTVTELKSEALVPFFISMIDANFLEGIQMLTSHEQLELFFTELVEMHINILRLLETCLLHDASTRMHILQDRVALGAIVSLLRIFSDVSEDCRSVCCELWRSVLAFLSTLVQMQCGPAVEVLAHVLSKQWPPIVENLQKILDGELVNSGLYLQCLEFLSAVFAEEGKLLYKYTEDDFTVCLTKLLNQPLESEADDENKDAKEQSTGSRFCKALVTSYDQYILRRVENGDADTKTCVITALKMLLAVSQSAKTSALELGLVENIIEHIKQTHAHLNMASLQLGKGPTATKGRDDPAIQEIIGTFDLLKNFMYQNEDVKMSCYHSGLASVVHKLWSWAQMDPGLMLSVLSLLTTYTATCSTAASSLAYTQGTSSVAVSQSKSGLSANSLVHCLMKYAAKDKQKESVLKAVFGLLTNLALSSECRNIIWKSNFLREFSDLNPKRCKSGKTKGRQQLLENLWLDLLLNLSFSLEGQQMILKIPDCVDLLLDFMTCGQTHQEKSSLMVIRNICCHSSHKPKLLANDKLLPRLLECVESPSAKLCTLAASALWALVFNNQKAKVVMKNGNVVPRLQGRLTPASNTEKTLPDKCLQDIQAVLQTVAE